MALPTIRLKKHEERRIRAGHLWIYSNEIDTTKISLANYAPGEQIIIEASNGKILGTGYINPQSLISVRLLSRDANQLLNKNLLFDRLRKALALRQLLFKKPYYRLVFGESDQLPGLIIDRFADILSVQITTAGMERVKHEIIAVLDELLSPSAILWRNDSSVRSLEGLPLYVEAALGEPPQQIAVIENEMVFQTLLWEGQKTGWFYDHRVNRANVQKYVAKKRVLDVFSYVGAWGISAAVAGAEQVVCIDSSQKALLQLQENARMNQVASRVQVLHEDAFKALSQLREQGEQFDVIILDPPAFIKRRKDLHEGTRAYQRINELAIRLLANEGILISASCSLHLHRDTLMHIVHSAGDRFNRYLQLIEQGRQGPDHPVHPAIPETDYLKAYACRVWGAF